MKTIVRIIKNAREWKWYLILATITLLIITAINLIAPMLIRELYAVLEENNANAWEIITILALTLLGLYLLRLLSQFINSYFSHIAAWRSVAKLRGDIYKHLQTLSMKYFTDKQTGQLMSRTIEDTANFEMLIAHALPDFISGVLMFAGVLVIIFFINPVLAALTCIPLPLVFLCTLLTKAMRKRFTERQKISAELNATLQDNFSGMKEIQIFNRQEYEYDKVYGKAKAHADKTIKGLFWVAVLHPSMNFLTGLGTFIVVLFGGFLAINGNMQIADITMFILYLGLLYAPVATFSRVLEDIQNALVSGKRVFEIIDTKSDVEDSPNAKEVTNLEGNIKFEKVSFNYSKDIAVLNNISFVAEKGKMVALVGPTGAGKTTITALLARFYDTNSGEITIDGINIKDMTLYSLRKQISVVLQDVFLFNGSIADNIAYGCENRPDIEKIREAAKVACIDEYIESLPENYNTLIGERGVRLSGGQKQRLAIARAILRNAPILILDEATSSVDNETETQIQNAINRIAGKCTVLVIAHRLSTIEKADQILMLSNGEIVERGTHGQLMEKGGAYAKLQKRT